MRIRTSRSIVLSGALAGIVLVALPGPAGAAQQTADVPVGPVNFVRFQSHAPAFQTVGIGAAADAWRGQEQADASVLRVITWSLMGTALGAAAGAAAGAAILDDDTELAGLEGAFAGAPFGAALGAGVGAHLGSRGRGSIVLTVLAPVAIVALASLSENEWVPIGAAALAPPVAVVLETVGPRAR